MHYLEISYYKWNINQNDNISSLFFDLFGENGHSINKMLKFRAMLAAFARFINVHGLCALHTFIQSLSGKTDGDSEFYLFWSIKVH